MANLADIYKKAGLVMKPAAMKEGKLYSQQPHSGAGDFTFSRANGVQTRINEHGLIETVADNTPRLSYDLDADGNVSECPTLLLEPTRQNVIQYSELFNNSYWVKENVTIGTGIVSPMGNTDAQNLIESTTTGRHRVRAYLAVSSGTTYSLSVWAKSTNRNLVINAELLFNARSGFNLSTGSVEDTTSGTATITSFPNDWFLCTVTGTATSTHTTFSYVQMQTGTTDANYTGDGSSTLSLFGAQLEAGSYPTSYIPTEGTTEVRYSDNCIINNYKNAPTAYPFTVFCEMDIIEDEKGYGFSIIDVSSSSNYFSVGYSEDSGTLGKFRFTNRAQVTAYNFNTLSTYATGRHKIAVKFISSTNFKGFINGVEVADYTHSSSPFNTNIKDILLGQLRASGDTGHRNPISQFILFNESLSDSELITLTT